MTRSQHSLNFVLASLPAEEKRRGSPDQQAWQKEAADVLEREHGLRASRVRHGVWTQLYVRGLTPDAAAAEAETYSLRASHGRWIGIGHKVWRRGLRCLWRR
jgi:hypothetical protein